ncbi:unnamed protein product [Tenebrio molitor]|nr:unnamed protein product [Tenebrio molitor]
MVTLAALPGDIPDRCEVTACHCRRFKPRASPFAQSTNSNAMKFASAARSPWFTLQFEQMESVRTSLSEFCEKIFILRHETTPQPADGVSKKTIVAICNSRGERSINGKNIVFPA